MRKHRRKTEGPFSPIVRRCNVRKYLDSGWDNAKGVENVNQDCVLLHVLPSTSSIRIREHQIIGRPLGMETAANISERIDLFREVKDFTILWVENIVQRKYKRISYL